MTEHSDATDSHALTEAVETLLLGGSRTITPIELAERAGIDRESGRLLWQAMGLATVPDDVVGLAPADLEAAQRVRRAVDLGIASFDDLLSLSRLTSQVFAQLADSEGEMLFALAAERQSGSGDFAATVEELAGEVLPLIEAMHTYVWRRQLSTYVARMLLQQNRPHGEQPVYTVGFADISGYTALSRRTGYAELAALLESFESAATTAVGAHGGRVVKLIGDAVLYTTDDPADGVQIAVDLLAGWPDTQPPIRAGIASGEVLRRLGDVFGPTVNIASRLTSVGRPGEIRVDEATHTAIASDPRFATEEQQPQDVRGYDHLASWLVSPQ